MHGTIDITDTANSEAIKPAILYFGTPDIAALSEKVLAAGRKPILPQESPVAPKLAKS